MIHADYRYFDLSELPSLYKLFFTGSHKLASVTIPRDFRNRLGNEVAIVTFTEISTSLIGDFTIDSSKVPLYRLKGDIGNIKLSNNLPRNISSLSSIRGFEFSDITFASESLRLFRRFKGFSVSYAFNNCRVTEEFHLC